MDDNDHWFDRWGDWPMWLDIIIFWLGTAFLITLVIAQRLWRDWRAERKLTVEWGEHRKADDRHGG